MCARTNRIDDSRRRNVEFGNSIELANSTNHQLSSIRFDDIKVVDCRQFDVESNKIELMTVDDFEVNQGALTGQIDFKVVDCRQFENQIKIRISN